MIVVDPRRMLVDQSATYPGGNPLNRPMVADEAQKIVGQQIVPDESFGSS